MSNTTDNCVDHASEIRDRHVAPDLSVHSIQREDEEIQPVLIYSLGCLLKTIHKSTNNVHKCY
jgi:hypothetical protein